MKKLIAFIYTMLILNIAFGQGIQFEKSTWTDILNKAQQEDKIVFVAVYSNSCHNCQYMAENVYPLKEVGAAYNTQYINVKVDADNGEGVDLAMQYEVIAYPTYLFLNEKGEQLHRVMGTMTAEKFIETAKRASNPDYQYFPLKKRFVSGDRSEDLLKRLTFMAKDLSDHELLDAVHIAYLATQQNWLTKENMEVILAGLKSIEQKTYSFLLHNRAAFGKEYGEVKINNLIERTALNSISLHAYDHAQRDFDLDKANAYGQQYLPPAFLDQIISLFTVNQYMRKQQTAEFLAAAVRYFDQYPCHNSFLLNNIALSFYENTDDQVLLEKALSWSLEAIELKDIHPFYDTAAALYFKLGEKEKAEEYALKAIQKAAESGDDAHETVALLEKIKSL